jgi:hypothetical protein
VEDVITSDNLNKKKDKNKLHDPVFIKKKIRQLRKQQNFLEKQLKKHEFKEKQALPDYTTKRSCLCKEQSKPLRFLKRKLSKNAVESYNTLKDYVTADFHSLRVDSTPVAKQKNNLKQLKPLLFLASPESNFVSEQIQEQETSYYLPEHLHYSQHLAGGPPQGLKSQSYYFPNKVFVMPPTQPQQFYGRTIPAHTLCTCSQTPLNFPPAPQCLDKGEYTTSLRNDDKKILANTQAFPNEAFTKLPVKKVLPFTRLVGSKQRTQTILANEKRKAPHCSNNMMRLSDRNKLVKPEEHLKEENSGSQVSSLGELASASWWEKEGPLYHRPLNLLASINSVLLIDTLASILDQLAVFLTKFSLGGSPFIAILTEKEQRHSQQNRNDAFLRFNTTFHFYSGLFDEVIILLGDWHSCAEIF